MTAVATRAPVKPGYVVERFCARGFPIHDYLKRLAHLQQAPINKAQRDVYHGLDMKLETWRSYVESNEIPLAVITRMFERFGKHDCESLVVPARRSAPARLALSYKPYLSTPVTPLHVPPSEEAVAGTIAPATPTEEDLALLRRLSVQFGLETPPPPPPAAPNWMEPSTWPTEVQAVVKCLTEGLGEAVAERNLLKRQLEDAQFTIKELREEVQTYEEVLDTKVHEGHQLAPLAPEAHAILKKVTEDPDTLTYLQRKLPHLGDTPFIEATERAAKTYKGLQADVQKQVGEAAQRFAAYSINDRHRNLDKRPDLDRVFEAKGVALLRAGDHFLCLSSVNSHWMLHEIVRRSDSRYFRNER